MSERVPSDQVPKPAEAERPNGAKLLIELAPLLAFFAAYKFYDMTTAAGVLAVATAASIVAAWFVLPRIPIMLWVTTVIAVSTATLTYLFRDPRFLQMKPTIVNLLFAAILAGGMATGRPFMKLVLGEAIQMTDTGWKKLTVRWLLFFIALAAANEFVWRNLSENAWVNFKFALLPISIAFTLAQLPLMKRYALDGDAPHGLSR